MKLITLLTLLTLLSISSCKYIPKGSNTNQDIFLNLQRQANGNYYADLSLHDPNLKIESIENTNAFDLDVKHVSFYNEVRLGAIAPRSITPVFNGQMVKGGIEAAITTPVNPWPSTIGLVIHVKR